MQKNTEYHLPKTQKIFKIMDTKPIIVDAEDAIEFMIAGASMVAVGTANFVDPCAAIKILNGINEYLDRHNIAKASDIVGSVQL